VDGLFVVEADVLVGEEVVAESGRVCEGLEDAVHETGVAFVSFLIWEFNLINPIKFHIRKRPKRVKNNPIEKIQCCNHQNLLIDLMFPLKETKFGLVDMILFHVINFTRVKILFI